MSRSLEQQFNVFVGLPEIDRLIYVIRQLFYRDTIQSTKIQTQQWYIDDFINNLPVYEQQSIFEQWIADQVHWTMERNNQMERNKPYQRNISIDRYNKLGGYISNNPPLRSLDPVNSIPATINCFPIPTIQITQQKTQRGHRLYCQI
jgi:hypothetical protein